MLYIYLSLLVGLCSIEVMSQDGPVSPSKRNRKSVLTRNSARTHSSRASTARKLFFEPVQEQDKVIRPQCVFIKKPKSNCIVPRLYKVLNALNALYEQDPSAYDNLACMFDEQRYQKFIDPQANNNPDVTASRQKKWVGYMKQFNRVGLIDESRDVVQFVYKNSFIATHQSPRVDEQVNFIALAPAFVKECSLPVIDTYAVPVREINQSASIDYPSYTDAVTKLVAYQQKHPNTFKFMAALFDENKYNKLMKTFSSRSKDSKSEWLTLLRSWHRNDLLTDDLRPVTSLELGYEYLTKKSLYKNQ